MAGWECPADAEIGEPSGISSVGQAVWAGFQGTPLTEAWRFVYCEVSSDCCCCLFFFSGISTGLAVWEVGHLMYCHANIVM